MKMGFKHLLTPLCLALFLLSSQLVHATTACEYPTRPSKPYEEVLANCKYAVAQAPDNQPLKYQLGRLYATQDTEKMLYWYKAAANGGYIQAQKMLASIYGIGLPSKDIKPSPPESFKWYLMAAEQGDASASYAVAIAYLQGRGVEKSKENGLHWLHLAGDRGDLYAQLLLGDAYSVGVEIPQSDTKAVKWYRKAAAQNDPHAQYRLGKAYHTGKGVEQSTAEAIALYSKAAKKSVLVKKALQQMYDSGEGITDANRQAIKDILIQD